MIPFTTVCFPAVFFAVVMSSAKCTHAKATKVGIDSVITKVSYRSAGGRSGNYESLDISADSVVYVQGLRGEEKSIKQKNSAPSWSELVGKVNLTDFDKIKSNPGHTLYDGIDVTITIETRDQQHSVVNGNEDTLNYRKIKPFIHLLEKNLDQFRQKISW